MFISLVNGLIRLTNLDRKSFLCNQTSRNTGRPNTNRYFDKMANMSLS